MHVYLYMCVCVFVFVCFILCKFNELTKTILGDKGQELIPGYILINRSDDTQLQVKYHTHWNMCQ